MQDPDRVPLMATSPVRSAQRAFASVPIQPEPVPAPRRLLARLSAILHRALRSKDAMLRHASQASIGLGLLNSLREPLAYVVLQANTVRLTGGNPALERLVERSSRELAGLPLARITTGVDGEDGVDGTLEDNVRDALGRHQHYCCRARVIDRFGAMRAVVLRVEPITGVTAADTRALVYLDPLEAEIEQLRLIATQFADSQRSLQEKSDRLLRLEQELNTLGSMMSHDLRAPLRTIDGFARILAEDHAGDLDRFAREHLERIQAGSVRMSRMIDAFRDLTLISARAFSPIPVDLSALAREVASDAVAANVEALNLAAQTQEHTARPVPQPRIEVEDGMRVQADPTMLRQLLANLLSNALKFSARETHPLVRVGMRRDAEGRATVFVQDNGAGFDKRFDERLFEPFQRLHSVSEYPGTGIGLAIARRIMRRHGGEIWADSTPGRGASFYFRLPG